MYARFWKRFFDFVLSLAALVVLSPLFLVLMLIGTVAMGGNPFFTQLRPGKIDPKTGTEKIFKLIKFRTMDNRKDRDGNFLPDEVRLNGYGRFLRSTSLDELPELVNILVGDMSLVGPRPQLVRDMVFMTTEQRRRHSVTPGLTGLAQVSGRNAITWEKKIECDLTYIDNGITLINDLIILFKTVGSVFAKEGITEEGEATATDLGDYLLKKGVVTEEEYKTKRQDANDLIKKVK